MYPIGAELSVRRNFYRLRTVLSNSPQVGIALGVTAAVVLGVVASKRTR